VSLVGPAALKICLRCFQISGEQRREREGRKRKEGKEKSDIYSKVPRSASKVTKKELKGEEGPYVYVTVGTTRFDALVAAASSTAFLTAAESVGFKRVLIQYGRGPCPDENSVLGCKLSFYSLKSDISEDVAKAGVVVSHGGAGSIFEALRAKQRLLVVCNPDLADNHQVELANAVCAGGHCCIASQPVTSHGLAKGLIKVSRQVFKTLPAPNPTLFRTLMDSQSQSPGNGGFFRLLFASALLALVLLLISRELIAHNAWE